MRVFLAIGGTIKYLQEELRKNKMIRRSERSLSKRREKKERLL